MPRNVTPLALIALIAVVAATVAALAGSTRDPSRATDSIAREADKPHSEPTSESSGDSVVDVARRYALVARNWTPASYHAAWERQIQLAGGPYRRALIARRPGRRELVALRTDRARSAARVVRTERDPAVQPPAARVLVTLDEATNAAGRTVRGTTLNEVQLRRHGRQWLVLGWTVIPGG